MRIPRIYQKVDLEVNATLKLDEDASRHLMTVLRLPTNASIYLFNGNGNKYLAHIVDIRKNGLTVQIDKVFLENHESPLRIHLGQVISKGERMDWVIQKATELGVDKITPLFSERCVVQLKGDRIEKRQEHWQRIAISACEQSDRNTVPTIQKPIDYIEWVMNKGAKTNLLKFILLPEAGKTLSNLSLCAAEKAIPQSAIALVIGPEGGLSDSENEYAISKGFIPIKLGPRILRTETAAIAAISILQYQLGDLG
jgi:16S rRNA (uracil1498-N3)-methyltransferase